MSSKQQKSFITFFRARGNFGAFLNKKAHALGDFSGFSLPMLWGPVRSRPLCFDRQALQAYNGDNRDDRQRTG